MSDFYLCMAFYERERKEVTVEHHYLAQIAQEVARVLVEAKDKDKITRAMFLLECKDQEEKKDADPEPDYEEAKKRIAASKGALIASMKGAQAKMEREKKSPRPALTKEQLERQGVRFK